MKRGGAVKKRGGGMMGPKKKMAKGGAIAKAKSRKPSGRLTSDDIKRAKAKSRKPSGRLTSDDIKRAMPTGRSAAAKKAAGKSKKAATFMGKFKQGKGNPAGKDLSMKGQLSSFLKRRRKSK